MKTYNPLLRASEKAMRDQLVKPATYTGIALKTIFLLCLTIATAFLISTFGFGDVTYADGSTFPTIKKWLIVSVGVAGLVAFVAIIVASFAPRTAILFAPIYAIAEGVIVGFLTTIISAYSKGAAIIAAVTTFAIFMGCLFLNMIASFRAKKFIVKFISIASFVLLAVAILFMILYFTGGMAVIASKLSPKVFLGLTIGVTVFMILYGIFMLMYDFIYAENIVNNGVDKRYEWSVALGFIFSIIWIYIEVLRLVAIISSFRDR